MAVEPETPATPPRMLPDDALEQAAGGGGPQIADIRVPGMQGSAPVSLGPVTSTGGGGASGDNGDGKADLVVGSSPSKPRRP